LFCPQRCTRSDEHTSTERVRLSDTTIYHVALTPTQLGLTQTRLAYVATHSSDMTSDNSDCRVTLTPTQLQLTRTRLALGVRTPGSAANDDTIVPIRRFFVSPSCYNKQQQ